jgi:hypothetical protein
MGARWLGWPQDLTAAEQREFIALEPFGGPDDGAAWTWHPEPGVVLNCGGGKRAGGGPKFTPDGAGGGVLQERSRTTMRWRDVAIVVPHHA